MKKEFERFSSYTVINLDNLEHNVRVIRQRLCNAKMLAVVKADGYNHGVQTVAEKMYRCGVRHFAVANIDEAIKLRSVIGTEGMILILGPTLPSRYRDAVKYNISLTVDSTATLLSIIDFLGGTDSRLNIHIALNTGMNRIGFDASEEELSDELRDVASRISECKSLVPQGIFSHLCDAENEDTSFTKLQYSRFENTVNKLSKAGLSFEYKHICNSAGTMLHKDFHCDLVRCGIALYGCEFEGSGLLPLMSFKTHIGHINTVKRGDIIGYGKTYTAEKDMRVATVTAGYADGFNRLLSNKGEVLIRGKRAPIVGRVCMDLTMVDISHIPDAGLFDEVTIIGKDGDEVITAEEVARLCDTISYEIICGIGRRVNRVYTENGKIVEKN